jgi:radical SAM protein with 4Fe4S-binding SPASM domain
VFVSHRGELQPCGYLDIQAGSVRKQEFAELWETAPLFRQLRNFGLLEGTCHACDYVRFCGGCRARAYEMTGNVMNEEPYCGYVPPAGVRDQQTA